MNGSASGVAALPFRDHSSWFAIRADWAHSMPSECAQPKRVTSRTGSRTPRARYTGLW